MTSRLTLFKWSTFISLGCCNQWMLTCVLTANLSLTFAATRQGLVSRSATLNDGHQVDSNAISYLSKYGQLLWDLPSGDVQVNSWMLRSENIALLTLTFSIQFSPIISCKISFSIFGLLQHWNLLTKFSYVI
jgi:hypothetical protein